jgi:hypothetical protein
MKWSSDASSNASLSGSMLAAGSRLLRQGTTYELVEPLAFRDGEKVLERRAAARRLAHGKT